MPCRGVECFSAIAFLHLHPDCNNGICSTARKTGSLTIVHFISHLLLPTVSHILRQPTSHTLFCDRKQRLKKNLMRRPKFDKEVCPRKKENHDRSYKRRKMGVGSFGHSSSSSFRGRLTSRWKQRVSQRRSSTQGVMVLLAIATRRCA